MPPGHRPVGRPPAQPPQKHRPPMSPFGEPGDAGPARIKPAAPQQKHKPRKGEPRPFRGVPEP